MNVTVTSDSLLAFRPLSVVREHDDFLVGNAASGIFLSIPEIGVLALRELEAGRTVGEAAAVASERAGQDVNVLEFAETLVETGLVTTVDGMPLLHASPSTQQRWLEGVPPALVRPFFSVPAWTVYGALSVLTAATFIARPELWPSFEDVFFYPNPAVCLVSVLVAEVVLAALHELSHWLAARAAEVGVVFRVSRRMFFPVFETDLSQLWSVPRRRRFSPLLAGMAFNTVVLALTLGLRLAWQEAWIDVPPFVARFLAMLVLVNAVMLGFQLLVFLRTDLYAVLVTVLRCRNLYRVNRLFLKSKLVGLTPHEQVELEDAHPRDRQVAPWFALLYLAGFAWSIYFFLAYFLPGTAIFAMWVLLNLGHASLSTSAFWQALAIAVVLAAQALAPLAIYVRERVQRARVAAA